MDMELYAGTMSRYYTQNGVAKDEDEQTNWTAEEAHDTVGKWQERILPELSREGEPPYEPWNEDEEDAYTAHMGWEAFGALLLCAACGVYKQPIPNTLHAGWDFEADPTIGRLIEDRTQVWSLFQGATCWLPLADCFSFKATMPDGETAVVGTLPGLKTELNRINELGWQADEQTILGWAETEGYPAVEAEQEQAYETASLAKYAFSLLWHAAAFAEQHHTPIILKP